MSFAVKNSVICKPMVVILSTFSKVVSNIMQNNNDKQQGYNNTNDNKTDYNKFIAGSQLHSRGLHCDKKGLRQHTMNVFM